MIKRYKNGIFVCCDEYVTAVQLYESLSSSEKDEFAKAFTRIGVKALQNYSTAVKLQCRSELLGLSGNSIVIPHTECCNITANSASETQNAVKLQQDRCNIAANPTLDAENAVTLQHDIQSISTEDFQDYAVTLQHLAEETAKMLYFYSNYCDFEEFSNVLDAVKLQQELFDHVKFAFLTGKFPESFINELQKCCKVTAPLAVKLQQITSKMLYFYSTVIIYRINKNIKGAEPLKNEVQKEKAVDDENFQNDIQKGFEGFGKVEVVDFNKTPEETKEDFMEVDDIPQQTLKRAERSMRAKNSYRNKPFIKIDRIKEIVDCLDEVVKSPVDFFIYQFWWGIFDLYCEHYHPSTRINEEGELEDEPQLSDWKEMIGAAIPQDEVYSLAQNIYEDLLGAVEQGKYVYGDNNEWEVKFGFKTFQDFNPYEIFQWSPCTMQDKSIPALKIAIDRFYDIEANDVFTPRKEDKRTKNSQNKKLISLILSSDDPALSPMESAIKCFYRDFVIQGEENIIDEFTDGKGTALESGGGLPDHLLKPWCYNLPSVRYNELTGVLNSQYKPCDGVHKKAYIFSAEKVVEWNERNGYYETVANKAIAL